MEREWIISDTDLGCDGAYFSYTEVVRCKDCKHWEGVERKGFYYFEHCQRTGLDALYYDFCSMAERKTDE